MKFMATQITTNPGSGSGNIYIDSLVWGNASWSLDEPINVSSWNPSTDGTSVIVAYDWLLSEAQAFDTAMANFSSVSNLTFNVVSPTSPDVDITWFISPTGGGNFTSNTTLGEHEVPDGIYTDIYGWFNASSDTWNNLTPGSFGYITIIHELGHGMGLAHPHDGGGDGNLFPGVTSGGDTGDYALNQGIWTTMTYNDGWTVEPTNTNDYGWQMTLMAFDIAALQAMYGANNTYNTGNNTYTIPTSSGSGVGWECIWDAGGSDTISNAGSNQGATINLNAAPLVGENAGGYVSWNSGVTGGYTIAYNVVIENAIGGNGNDVITGNSANNTIHGNAGNNTIDGGTGNDTLVINANYADTIITINSDNSVNIVSNDSSFSNEVSNVETFTFNDQMLLLSELNTNNAPTVSSAITDASTNEDASYSYDTSANFTDVDVNDVLTYSATLANGSALPSWLSINTTTGVLSGTTVNSDVGIINVVVTATDSFNATVSDTYTLTVNNTNDTPTVSSAITDASTNEDASYSYDTSANFTDVDVNDVLTYSATLANGSALPSWLSINTTTGVLSGTPLNGNDGTMNITVTATDIAGSAVSDTYTLTVNNSNLDNVELNGIVRDNITVNSGTTLTLIGNVQIASGVTISVAAGGQIDLGGFSISNWGTISLQGNEASFALMQNGDYSSEASTSVLNINYGHLNNIEGDPFSDDGLLTLNNSYVNNSSIEALDNNTIINSLFNNSSLSLDNQNASIEQSTFLQSQISALALFGTVNISETNFINNSIAIYLNPLYGNSYTHNINIVDSYIHSYNNESIEYHIYDADDNLSLNANISETSFVSIPFYNSSSAVGSSPDTYMVGGMYIDWVNLTVEEAHNIITHTPGTDVTGTSGIDDLSITSDFADNTVGITTDDDGNATVIITDASGNTTTITDVENFEFSDQSFTAAALQANNDVRPLFASPQLENGTWVNSYILPDVFSSGNAGLDALYDYQFFGDTGGNILVASDKNDFINGFGGDDAINTGAGNDIIDGGLGSNFLTGGSGNDTFFSDGREVGNGAITWSTVTDFTAGTNSVNIWGYIDGTSTYEWYADAGATGWTGATLHADLDGNGTIDTSMTFTGLNVSEMNAPQGLEVGGNGYLLIG